MLKYIAFPYPALKYFSTCVLCTTILRCQIANPIGTRSLSFVDGGSPGWFFAHTRMFLSFFSLSLSLWSSNIIFKLAPAKNSICGHFRSCELTPCVVSLRRDSLFAALILYLNWFRAKLNSERFYSGLMDKPVRLYARSLMKNRCFCMYKVREREKEQRASWQNGEKSDFPVFVSKDGEGLSRVILYFLHGSFLCSNETTVSTLYFQAYIAKNQRYTLK